MSKLPTGEKLLEEAIKYGVDISGDGMVTIPGRGTVPVNAPDHVIQSRLLAAKAYKRNQTLYWVAIVSAVISVLGAVASWVALLKA